MLFSSTRIPCTSIGREKYNKLNMDGSVLPFYMEAKMGCAKYYSVTFYCDVFLPLITFSSAVCS